jgi:hypothetical protein
MAIVLSEVYADANCTVPAAGFSFDAGNWVYDFSTVALQVLDPTGTNTVGYYVATIATPEHLTEYVLQSGHCNATGSAPGFTFAHLSPIPAPVAVFHPPYHWEMR